MERRKYTEGCLWIRVLHAICSNGDQHLLMTEDHRLTSKDERLRLLERGKQLKEGENRLAGKSKFN